MPEEILNIEHHTKRLILKALNSSRTNEEAAKLLGISWRTLYQLMDQFNIIRIELYAVKEEVKAGRIRSKASNQYKKQQQVRQFQRV